MSKDVTDDGYEFMVNQKPTQESIKKFKAGDFKDYIPHILTDKQTFIQCFKDHIQTVNQGVKLAHILHTLS